MYDLQRISDALRFVPADDRDQWLRMGMAIKSAAPDGFDLWNDWSASAPTYNPSDAKAVWKSIRPDGAVTLGTLFHEAKANGWTGAPFSKPSAAELEERKRAAKERAKQEAEAIEKERAGTAAIAKALIKAASNAKADNPYLKRKGIAPTPTLYEIEAAADILGYIPKAGGKPLTGRLLVVPIKQNNRLASVELIDGSGNKTALAGRGTKSGGYWASGPLKGDALLLAEGVATAISANEATGLPAVAALSDGNLPKVATYLHERFPDADIIVLADLLKDSGAPDRYAVEAAQAVGGKLALPDFGANRDPDAKDFNDLHQYRGLQAVADVIAKAQRIAGVETVPANDPGLWQVPQSLTARINPEPYPLDALPDVIQAAVQEVVGFVKAPIPLVVTSALSALSLVCQAHINVKRDEKLQGPVSLYLLAIADSGERKTTCDGFFSQAIREYEEAEAEAAQSLLKDYWAASKAWDAKRSGIMDKIRQLSKDGKQTTSLEMALRDLENDKPEAPRVPRLLYSDATPEALSHDLANGWPSGGILSSEAGTVLGSHGMTGDSLMRNLALLNQLWDGATLTVDRKKDNGSFKVRGARLTVGLQVQEVTLRDFFKKSGQLARGTGFLARFLIAWPESTQGHRPFTEAPTSWPALAKFNRRISDILEEAPPMNDQCILTPTLLSMTAEAKDAWIAYHDAIESELSANGELHDVRDVAAKSADNAARLAALFQLFSGTVGTISLDALTRACRITAWHLHESRRFFGELALPTELADAVRLDQWLVNYCQSKGLDSIPKNDVRQYGPLRNGARLDAAIHELTLLDRLRLDTEGRRQMIRINPALLGGRHAD